jgi:hypothetical protein
MVKRVKAPFDPADYSIAVRRNRKPYNSWRWEINGAGKSIPVQRSASHFETMAEATKAGKAALEQFVKLRAQLSVG